MITNKEKLLDLFCRLVSCDSPSYGENAVRDAVISELKSLGISVEEDGTAEKIGGTCGNLYAKIDGDPSLAPVLLSAHLDTVEPSVGKKAVVHPDGLITSAKDTVLGADDAAGLASILHAIRNVIEKGVSHRPVELVFDVCEERYCVGIQKFDYTKISAKQVYVLDVDGRVGRAATQAPSIVQYKAVFTGRAAHAGFSPEEGLHAIKTAAEAISKISCGRTGDMTVNIGSVSGGIADNIVPPECTVTGELRGFNNEEVAAKTDEIGALMKSVAEKNGLSCDFSRTVICRAFKTGENSEICRNYAEACKKSGVIPEFIKTYGASTNNHWSEWGFCGLVISCGMNNCHSVEEWTTADELCRSAEIVYNII
ncbi:MAG: M20/M25/M40 family metallo-hydrolase, partial [Clostridia bacterium]|nr:M20/M25/M40 family metallo-hydrolase [Clostridia bacterium]